MTIKEIPEIITCTYCKSGDYNTLKGVHDDEELHQCKKCGALTDFKLRKISDYLHKIYHETGKDGGDMQNISPEDRPKGPPDGKVNIFLVKRSTTLIPIGTDKIDS